MSLDFAEIQPTTGEITPLPTWLMAKDSKTAYDVSIPLSAFGCLNVFILSNRPKAILQTLHDLCQGVASKVTAQVNRAADVFFTATDQKRQQSWMTQVLTFEEYLVRLRAAKSETFDARYQKLKGESTMSLRWGKQTMAAATWSLLDGLAELDDSSQPVVVVGFVPPIYPSLSYHDRPEFAEVIQRLSKEINALTAQWGQTYQLEPYYRGISDLSYTSLNDAQAVEKLVSANMPMYGDFYNLPFTHLGEISMPCINVGPRGKDFHKLEERVLKEDLLERTPQILLTAIQAVLRGT